MLHITVDEESLRELTKEEVRKHLEGMEEEGTWWNLKRLETQTCRKRDWLIENILLNPRFKEEMKLISNGCENGRWMFRAKAMKSFLDEYFHHLNRGYFNT